MVTKTAGITLKKSDYRDLVVPADMVDGLHRLLKAIKNKGVNHMIHELDLGVGTQADVYRVLNLIEESVK
jgi:hypothetical protein